MVARPGRRRPRHGSKPAALFRSRRMLCRTRPPSRRRCAGPTRAAVAGHRARAVPATDGVS
eukprot:2580820-Prymnesium_polylepis.1